MRLPEKILKVAIYGASATGKTSVAMELGKLIHATTIRNCGEIIKRRSKEINVPLSSLTAKEHRNIDDETRQFVIDARDNIVVEGRYLNYVLNGIDGLTYIKLVCAPEERVARLRKDQYHSEGLIEKIDSEDFELISRLYDVSSPYQGRQEIIDTTHLLADECAAKLLENIMKGESGS